jgi:uncharacterized protein (DUF302 family)
MEPEGLVVRQSDFDFQTTIDRLVEAITARGVSILARIDHAEGAHSAGLPLDPMVVLIFGNPRAGTPLMQMAPAIGIDLPLRALVWQDAGGATSLGYNDPTWLARRHHIGAAAAQLLHAMTGFLEAVAQAATTAA